MSVERIFWLIIGIVLIIFAVVAMFSDGLNIEQKTMDAIQNVVLGIFALGLAYRAGPPIQ